MNTFSGIALRQISVVVLFVIAALGCKKNDESVASPQTITDRILEDNQFTILRSAVSYAGVGDQLKAGNLTFFAPNDAAFQAAGVANDAVIKSLSKEQVKAILLYHMLYASVSSSAIPSGINSVETASKGVAFLNKGTTGTIYVNSAKITQPDVAVANGYVHVIDRLLTPSTGNLLTTIQNNPNLTFLAAAIKRIGASNQTLLNTLSNTSSTNTVTVFAPNDAAFKADGRYTTIASIESANQQTLSNILLYHVTSGVLFSSQLQSGSLTSLLSNNRFTVSTSSGQVTVKGTKNNTAATIKQADIPTTNGVIHIIDQVLQP
jgi:uncharacterized surface protein with fasciclin (FAS1) repeats